MLAEFVENTKIENYGGYDEWEYCGSCGQPYHLLASVKAANRVIAGVDVCDKCFAREAYSDPRFPVQQPEDEERDETDWLSASPPADDDLEDDKGDSSEVTGEPEGNEPHISPEEANEALLSLLEGVSPSVVTYRLVIGDSPHSRSPEHTVTVDSLCTPADLVAYLIEEGKLLLTEPDGPPIAYTLMHNDTALQRDVAITEQRVSPDSLLRIRGELVQGGPELQEWGSQVFGRPGMVQRFTPSVHSLGNNPSITLEEADRKLMDFFEEVDE